MTPPAFHNFQPRIKCNLMRLLDALICDEFRRCSLHVPHRFVTRYTDLVMGRGHDRASMNRSNNRLQSESVKIYFEDFPIGKLYRLVCPKTANI